MDEHTTEQHKKTIEKQLWNITNIFRGNMSVEESRDYILVLIFYKFLSERMSQYADSILENENINFRSIDESTDDGQEYLTVIKEESNDYLGYFLKPSELFQSVIHQHYDICEVLNHVFQNIQYSALWANNEDNFNGLLDSTDFSSNRLGGTRLDRNNLVNNVLFQLNKINFSIDKSSDFLGDAYEYLIGQFARSAGKKGGEFYTPPMVSKLLAKLVTKERIPLTSVYDPACGSGSLLLQVVKEIKTFDSEIPQVYGQEKNYSSFNIARMNILLHDIHYKNFDIQHGDTLESPLHFEKRFDAIVSVPPFSSYWQPENSYENDIRFGEIGRYPPKNRADFAFVLHMLHQLDETGTMAVVLPHGVLFRGNAESYIRQFLIEEKNYLDAVIGLPTNLLFGTAIPTCILLFKKHRKNKKDIIFIDASIDVGKNKSQNFLREENISNIIKTVVNRQNIEQYSKVVSLKDIANNDYTLSINLYVKVAQQTTVKKF